MDTAIGSSRRFQETGGGKKVEDMDFSARGTRWYRVGAIDYSPSARTKQCRRAVSVRRPLTAASPPTQSARSAHPHETLVPHKVAGEGAGGAEDHREFESRLLGSDREQVGSRLRAASVYLLPYSKEVVGIRWSEDNREGGTEGRVERGRRPIRGTYKSSRRIGQVRTRDCLGVAAGPGNAPGLDADYARTTLLLRRQDTKPAGRSRWVNQRATTW
ncbi:hypothetical protein GQ53DRAFT_461667 [Thozetella sp. PMI_491]|nr:hypothetical protein GQ53DRAFT_461667 [Thozetella sp. PMI_491]